MDVEGIINSGEMVSVDDMKKPRRKVQRKAPNQDAHDRMEGGLKMAIQNTDKLVLLVWVNIAFTVLTAGILALVK